MQSKRNIAYISHGGGPMPLLGDPHHDEMIKTLTKIAVEVTKPSAILVISAHWEAHVPTVTSAKTTSMIYDYGGFPQKAYAIQYPASGEPMLANAVVNALKDFGIDALADEQRGIDHGLFVPLKIMYPYADIPCVQLSLVRGLNPNTHIQIGKALQRLNWENLLVIGSGFSFHNMRAFFTPHSEEALAHNIAFDDWLRKTISDKTLSETSREQKLKNWMSAPSAKYCHPRAEHLIPLHVCYGMAGKPSRKNYQVEIMQKQSSMFLWSE